MDDSERRHLPTLRACFVCGEENHAGLQTRFYIEDGLVKGRVRPRAHHCGYENVVHGGVTAGLIDECMAWAASRAIGRMCVTGELTVRYLARVPCDRDLTVCARTTKSTRRLAYVKASLRDDDDVEYARAKGTFLPISVAETLAVDDAFVYRGDEERVFARLREEHEGRR